MTLEFFRGYGGGRMADYAAQPPLLDPPRADGTAPAAVTLDYELDPDAWTARPVEVPDGWRAADWAERPLRFVDGKDVGATITWLTAPNGMPIPVRLSQIGATAIRVADGRCKRQFAEVERVVSMVVDPFPWDEVESLATALHQRGFRLLPAEQPRETEGQSPYDFETMRKATQNRSNTEMGTLEEAAVAREAVVPTVIDGRLEPRSGGFKPASSPVIGVVKTQHQNYLHPRGLQVQYGLRAGERTPLFAIDGGPQAGAGPHTAAVKLPVVSWYVRLVGAPTAMPTWGVVRVELPKKWFEARFGRSQAGWDYVNRLSRLLADYRCRDGGYGRAAVSLHPIMRAEQLLGALFLPSTLLAQRFYRMTGL